MRREKGEIEILPPGTWENDEGPREWWAIATDEGIVAYAGDEDRAIYLAAALECR